MRSFKSRSEFVYCKFGDTKIMVPRIIYHRCFCNFKLEQWQFYQWTRNFVDTLKRREIVAVWLSVNMKGSQKSQESEWVSGIRDTNIKNDCLISIHSLLIYCLLGHNRSLSTWWNTFASLLTSSCRSSDFQSKLQQRSSWKPLGFLHEPNGNHVTAWKWWVATELFKLKPGIKNDDRG